MLLLRVKPTLLCAPPSPSLSASSCAAGLGEIRCTPPTEESSVPLSELTEVSFRDCTFRLSLVDLLIIVFSGAAVSIAAIISSFVLALLVNCFQRCTPRKDEEEEEEEEG